MIQDNLQNIKLSNEQITEIDISTFRTGSWN